MRKREHNDEHNSAREIREHAADLAAALKLVCG